MVAVGYSGAIRKMPDAGRVGMGFEEVSEVKLSVISPSGRIPRVAACPGEPSWV